MNLTKDVKDLYKENYGTLEKEMEEDNLFNKWCWENSISTSRRLKLDHYLSPCTKIKSKMDQGS
jgi:hypothetical protein